MCFLRQFKIGLAYLVALVVWAPSTLAFADPPTAEDFIPQFSGVSLSPNGQFVAMLRPLNGRNALMVQNLDNPRDRFNIPAGDGVSIINYRWYNDELILLNVGWGTSLRPSANPRDVSDIRAMSVRLSGTSLIVQDLGRWGLGAIIDDLDSEPNSVLLNFWDVQHSAVVSRAQRVNVYNGATLNVNRGRSSWGYFVSDLRGRVRTYVDGDRETNRVWTQDPGSVEWNLIHESARFGAEQIAPHKVLQHGRYLYLSSSHEGRVGLYKMDIEARGGLERVFLHDTYDMRNFQYNDRGRLLYVTYMADQLEFHFFDEDTQALHERVNRLLPGTREVIVSSDDANNRHIIHSSGPGEPPTYYFMDEDAHSITELAIKFPDISPAQAASVEAFSYTARDGLEIPAYLATPPGAGEEPLPLVVMPHGGPHFVRDSQEFDALRQFIATRGFAVLTPNFRGSSGYGNEFYSRGLQEWGIAMQNDITDGVQHLIDQGRVDPSRICIVGWSYGAYASMTGLVQTPEQYQCGVAINGVYDLAALQRQLGRTFNYGNRDWWRFSMGREADELNRISPARHADQIQSPVLILYSEEDRTVPEGQHELMVEAMEEAGVDYQERVFEEGNHGMNYGPSRIETYELIERFLTEHLQ